MPWLRQEYTTIILESRGGPQPPVNPGPWVPHTWCPMIQQRLKSHPLNLINPQPPPSSIYMIKKSWVFVCHRCNLNMVRTNSSTTRIPSLSIMGCYPWPTGGSIWEGVLPLYRSAVSIILTVPMDRVTVLEMYFNQDQ